ncbi:MAG: DUF5686 family protein, partial [Bacteroidota bacterium]
MHLRLLFLLGMLCSYSLGWTQGVKGRITTPDGDPIAYVRVNAIDAQVGTLSDAQGRYELSLGAGTHQILFTHFGYRQHQVEVIVPKDRSVDVILLPTDFKLDPVDIKGGKRDPAYDIMADLIEHRKERLRQYESYSAHTYLKVTLMSDSIPKEPLPDSLIVTDTPKLVKLIESQSQTNFQQPGKYKSIVEGYRFYSPSRSRRVGLSLDGIGSTYSSELNDPYLFYLDVSQADFNFYENLISVPTLSDRPLVSPLNSNLWRIIYAFKLNETFYQDNKVHYRIQIAPRNRDGPYFAGEIVVVDGDWAIREASLKVMRSTMSHFDEFRLEHHYEPTKDGRWLLTEETYNYEVRERKMRYIGESIARHSDFELDVTFPKRFFNNELRRTEQEAFERDSSYWASLRPVELQSHEEAFIGIQDSIIAYRSSAEFLYKLDSADNQITWQDVLIEGIRFKNRKRKLYYYIGPLAEQPQPFGVGGYRHQVSGGFTKVFASKKKISVFGRVNYGFANQDFKGGARVRYTYAPKRFGSFYVRGGDFYDFVTLNTTLTAIIGRNNFIRRTYIGAGHSIELLNGLYLDVGLDFSDRSPIDSLNLSEWSEELFGSFNTPRSFTEYKEMLVDI